MRRLISTSVETVSFEPQNTTQWKKLIINILPVTERIFNICYICKLQNNQIKKKYEINFRQSPRAGT